MKVFTVLAVALFVGLTMTESAVARGGRVCFGDDEHVAVVSKTELRDVSGAQLNLSKKWTMRCFIVPYTVTNDGLVLTIAGQSDRYYPMPSAERVAELQSSGLLPNPLPVPELRYVDIFFGHLLWYLVAFIVGVIGWAMWKGRRSAA